MAAWMVEHWVEKMVASTVGLMVAQLVPLMVVLLAGRKVDSMAESWVVR